MRRETRAAAINPGKWLEALRSNPSVLWQDDLNKSKSISESKNKLVLFTPLQRYTVGSLSSQHLRKPHDQNAIFIA